MGDHRRTVNHGHAYLASKQPVIGLGRRNWTDHYR